jgi:fucose permease
MGIYTLTFFGLMPIGALWIGFTAEHVSQTAAILMGAGVMIVAAAALAVFMPHLRRQG